MYALLFRPQHDNTAHGMTLILFKIIIAVLSITHHSKYCTDGDQLEIQFTTISIYPFLIYLIMILLKGFDRPMWCLQSNSSPHNKVHGVNMGPTWVLSAPDGPHVDPMILAIRVSVVSPILWRSSHTICLLDCYVIGTFAVMRLFQMIEPWKYAQTWYLKNFNETQQSVKYFVSLVLIIS